MPSLGSELRYVVPGSRMSASAVSAAPVTDGASSAKAYEEVVAEEEGGAEVEGEAGVDGEAGETWRARRKRRSQETPAHQPPPPARSPQRPPATTPYAAPSRATPPCPRPELPRPSTMRYDHLCGRPWPILPRRTAAHPRNPYDRPKPPAAGPGQHKTPTATTAGVCSESDLGTHEPVGTESVASVHRSCSARSAWIWRYTRSPPMAASATRRSFFTARPRLSLT